MIYNILLIVQVIVALGIIGFVLVQHGKGADAGAAFGSGSSGSVFGSRGASNFLTRSTAILAVVFFLNSMALAWIVSNRTSGSVESVTDSLVKPELKGSIVPADVPSAGDGNSGNDVPSAVQGDTPSATQGDVPAAVQSDTPSATQGDVPAAKENQ